MASLMAKRPHGVSEARSALPDLRPGRLAAVPPLLFVATAVCGQPAIGTAPDDAARRTHFLPASERAQPLRRDGVEIEKLAPGAKVAPTLLQLHDDYERHLAARDGRDFLPRNPLLHVAGRYVAIDAAATGETEDLRAALEALGLERGASYGRMVGGLLPIAAIAALEGLPSMRLVRASIAGTNTGSVTSQGDAAARSDVARSTFGVDGSGVTVGLISDSFDCNLDQQAVDEASGDLSPTSRVLAEPVR